MLSRGTGCTINLCCEKHDVVMRCPCVNDICSTPHVIRGEVKSNEPMVIYAPIFKEHKTRGISFGEGSGIGGRPHVRVLWTGFSLLLKYCTDMREQVVPQLQEKILPLRYQPAQLEER